MPNTKNQNPSNPCPGENEGNIVNVSNCCQEEKKTKDPKYVILEKEEKNKKCCFNVYITRCWLTHNKDWNPEGGLILMGYANEQSGVAPGLGTTIKVHPKHGWINLNQKIGTFEVNESNKFPVLLRADALEWGNGLDGASDVGSDLEPDQKGTEIILDCNAAKVPITQLAIKLQRPRGGDAGRVVIEFAAFKTSCSL